MADTVTKGPQRWFDSFVNLLSGLGVPGRDKFESQAFTYAPMSQYELEAAYRGNWIARKIVDLVAWDQTREWRSWQASNDQIEKIEETEKKLFVQQKVQQALIRGRLYGGAAIIIGVADSGAPDSELLPEDVAKDSLKFLHVVSALRMTSGPLITDVLDPYYGQPEWFEVRSGGPGAMMGSLPSKTSLEEVVQLHPSRVVRFIGLPVPDEFAGTQMTTVAGWGWGDSVLQPVNDAVRACGLVSGSMATLISELKIDIIKVPNLSQILSTQEGTDKVKLRFSTANAAKSVINTVLLDKEEDWQRVSANLNDVPNVIATYLQIASGAADIPATRFLGTSPGGLNSTGESDLRNYYDRARSEQATTLTPAMSVLDEVIIRSALGSRPPEIWYTWNPLWQITPTDKAEIALKYAQAYRIDADEGQIPSTALANARINQLIEGGVYPGLEAALADAAAEGETVEEWNKTPPIPTQPREQVRPAGTEPLAPGMPPPQRGAVPVVGPPQGNGGAPPPPGQRDFNPHHQPGGSPEGGQFASGGGETAAHTASDEVQRLSVQREGVSFEDQMALRRYVENSYGLVINKALRGQVKDAGALATAKRFIDAYDRNALPVKADLTTYRGVSGKMLDALKEGDTFVDKGIISTTASKKWAEQFAKGKTVSAEERKLGGMMIEVHIPKGTKAMGGSAGSKEMELILRPGSKFKVIKHAGNEVTVEVQ